MRVSSLALAILFVLVFGGGVPVSSQQSSQTTFPEQKPKNDSGVSGSSQNSDADAEKEGEEDRDFARKREEWFIGQRAYPFAHIPSAAREAAIRQYLAMKRSGRHSLFAVPPSGSLANMASGLAVKAADSFATLSWTFDGPSSISWGAGQTPYSGRATSLAINPTNPLIMYFGTAAGGVWETKDGGQTWNPITDSQASLAIGAIAIDPTNPNTIYVGTGEADYSGDSYYGEGLLKSIDGGKTWTQISSPFVSGGAAGPFAQIAIQPGNSSVLLAATSSGLYRSTDAGTTWTNEIPSYASAVIFDPTNSSVAYAGMNGYFNSIVYGNVTAAIYKSTDAGKTWTALTGSTTQPLPAGKLVYRTSLFLDSAGNLLAGIAPSNAGSGTPYKSTDGGNTWTALTAPGDGLDWYRDWIISVPGSPNIMYTGGVNLFQSLDGGTTWTKSTESYAALLWADQHSAVFSPDGSKMYVMDDGGIFETTSPAATNPAFLSLNNSIGSMTFYPGFGITGTNSTGTLVGAQDHGTQIGTGSLPWNYAGGGNVCGDGGPVVMDSAGIYAYAHCEGSPLSIWMASPTAGALLGQGYPYGWVSAQSGINTSDRTAWIPPIATDPSNAPNVYAGTYRVYQSLNHAGSWTTISGDLTAGQTVLNTIAVSPTDANTIYTGAGDGTVSVTTNALAGAGATWKGLSGLPNRSISKIVVMPDSSQDVYVVVGGFGSGHLFHSENGGTTWTDISGDLPDTPADSVAIDPSLIGTIYLATDTGVYVTSNGGAHWEILGANLPNVVVQDVQLVAASRILRVVTHGRGAWDTTLPLNGFVASTNTLSFGTQLLNTQSATQTITLTNDLYTAVSISGITVSSNWIETNTCGSSLASGTTCTVTVTFEPTTLGANVGTLSVQSAQGNISISLTGTGIAPAVAFSSSTVAFTSQSVGVASAPQTVNLKNTGTALLTNIAISVSGSNASEFAQTNNCGSSVAAGSSCTISIVFTPAAVGPRAASLAVADNASGSPQTVSITGTGIAPAVSLSTATITFTSQPVGIASPSQPVTVQNSGTASLTGIAVSITGTNASDFSQTNTCGTTLAASASCSISVIFTPGATGSRQASLHIADNASGSPQTVQFQGTGTAPFALSATPTTASVAQGATANYGLTFAAATGTTTSSSAALSCSGLPSESTCVFSPTSIPAGTSTQAVTLNITTTAASSAMLPKVGARATVVLAFGLFALWLIPGRRIRNLLAVLFLLVLAYGVTACGGGNKQTTVSNPGTPTGAWTVTVSAKTTAYTATQSLSLNVTQ